jgi:hypothetical protein
MRRRSFDLLASTCCARRSPPPPQASGREILGRDGAVSVHVLKYEVSIKPAKKIPSEQPTTAEDLGRGSRCQEKLAHRATDFTRQGGCSMSIRGNRTPLPCLRRSAPLRAQRIVSTAVQPPDCGPTPACRVDRHEWTSAEILGDFFA